MIDPAPKLGILRYSAGNATSVARALNRLSIPSKTVENIDDLPSVSGLLFPGAGAAQSAMNDLKKRGWIEALKQFPKPFLGLCLGMQIPFDHSEEGDADCLGIIPGKVCMLPDDVIRPHMGWNMLSTGTYAYFVHGFVCEPDDKSIITMTTRYGGDICAGVRWKNFFGVQWHPEKSGIAGDDLLLSFAELCKARRCSDAIASSV